MDIPRTALIASVVKPVAGTSSIWFDVETINELLGQRLSVDEIQSRFSVVTPSVKASELWGDKILNNCSYDAFLEMYGGGAIATHAGGARSVIKDGILLKGVGVNKLLGIEADSSHSHGSLCLIDGVVELIYSRLLNVILPEGSVHGLGLILTGEDTAISQHPNQQCESKDYGSIFLREACSRPATFLPAGRHRSGSEKVPVNDPLRLSQQFKGLLAVCGSASNLVNWFCQFAASCANQFAYAFVNGVMHGSLSESNFAMSGKWLDLTLATFVDNRKNYAITGNPSIPCFYSEHKFPPPLFSMFMWELSKYLDLSINSQPIVDLYFRQFGHKVEEYIIDYICVDRSKFDVNKNSKIINSIYVFLSSKPKIVFASPMGADTDVEVDLFVSLLRLHNSGWDFGLVSGAVIHPIVTEIMSVVNEGMIFPEDIDARIARRIVFLCYKRIFYRARIIEELRASIYSAKFELEALRSLVEGYLLVIREVFGGVYNWGDKVIVFSSCENKIEYYEGFFYLNGRDISASLLSQLAPDICNARILISDVVIDVISALTKAGSLKCSD